MSNCPGKEVARFRYYYDYHGVQTEIDVFKDDLEGLVVVDVEFAEKADKDSFIMPEFCLADITQDEIFAGGMLCGKKYADIKQRLNELGYQKIGLPCRFTGDTPGLGDLE